LGADAGEKTIAGKAGSGKKAETGPANRYVEERALQKIKKSS
jgi:hypothetical protein